MAYRFYRCLLIAVLLLLAFVDPALANWWIVRAADNKCLVVDMEPSVSDKDITKVGKDVYPTREQAEADVKKVCKEGPPPRTPGNAGDQTQHNPGNDPREGPLG